MTRAALIAVALVIGCRDSGPAASPPARPPMAEAPPPDAAIDSEPAQLSIGTGGCPDPIIGVWTGRHWEGDQWQEYRVEIGRRPNGALACQQRSRAWDGPLDQVAIPRCPDGQPLTNVTTLTCTATLADANLAVDSERIHRRYNPCSVLTGVYFLDHFTGPVTNNTWQATNRYQRDDGTSGEEVVRFHRLACEP